MAVMAATVGAKVMEWGVAVVLAVVLVVTLVVAVVVLAY
tara:strand:+ start:353 stop:469 length:117 start_codon:yes stop_codon:yes gene_type:complete